MLPAMASAQVSLPFTDTFATNSLTSYTQTTGRTMFVHSTTAGSDGANGRLNTPTDNNTYAASLTSTVGDFTEFSSYTISIDFLTNSSLANTGTGVNMAAVGISDGANQFYLNAQYVGFEVTARMTSTSGDTVFRVRRNGLNTTGNEFVSTTPFTLATSTWYRLSTTISQIAENTFSLESKIIRISDSVTLGTFSVASVTNTSITPTTDIFAGFAAHKNSSRGSLAVDNFNVSAIPEPSGAAALFGGMALASVGLRRRRRAA
jgi:hypothetical protein